MGRAAGQGGGFPLPKGLGESEGGALPPSAPKDVFVGLLSAPLDFDTVSSGQ